MKISAKGRYGLAAMTYLALNYASGAPVTIISISEKLGISKMSFALGSQSIKHRVPLVCVIAMHSRCMRLPAVCVRIALTS